MVATDEILRWKREGGGWIRLLKSSRWGPRGAIIRVDVGNALELFISGIAEPYYKPSEIDADAKDNGVPPHEIRDVEGAAETPAQHLVSAGTDSGAKAKRSAKAEAAMNARAMTVAQLVDELDILHPQMFEDDSEYDRLTRDHPDFLCFKIAAKRRDLRGKIMAIQGTTRHKWLAKQLAAAHYGVTVNTIEKAWKLYKPAKFRR